MRFGLSLSRFEKRTLRNELRHNLLRKIAKDSEEHEHAKHLVLETLDTVLGFEERKANEQRLRDKKSLATWACPRNRKCLREGCTTRIWNRDTLGFANTARNSVG